MSPRQIVGAVLLLALVGVSAALLAYGRPRLTLPAVTFAPNVAAAPISSPLSAFANAALASYNGRFPAQITVGGRTIKLVAAGRGRVRLCAAGDCVTVDGATRQVTASP